MDNEVILAIDVGKGTEDVMVYSGEPIENSIQMVLPSTAQKLSKVLSKIEAATSDNPVIVKGNIMAGEPWHKEVYRLCDREKHSVVMTETSGKSLRYNLNQVKNRGVKITSSQKIKDYMKNEERVIHTSDVDWDRLKSVLSKEDILDKITTILLCCQDHGEPDVAQQSTRDFRMNALYRNIEDRGDLTDLLWRHSGEIPAYFPRFRAICEDAKEAFPWISEDKIFVMDSSPAVLLGALTEEIAGKRESYSKESDSEKVIINVGNGHTVAAFVENEEVLAIYETHTGGVDPDGLMNDLKQIVKGELNHKQALERGAHGMIIRKEGRERLEGLSEVPEIILVGPNRKILSKLPHTLSHPSGSMMMAGPVGLLAAYKKRMKGV